MSKKIRLGYDILSKRAIETESGVNIDDALKKITTYKMASGTGADSHPDVARPSDKIFYIVKVVSAGQPDMYMDWIWNQPSDGPGFWICVGRTLSPEDSWKRWSEARNSIATGDNSVYVGSDNTIERNDGYAFGTRNTIRVTDDKDYTGSEAVSIGRDNVSLNSIDSYNFGHDNEVSGGNPDDIDSKLAMNLGAGNKVVREGVNIGKENASDTFGITVGQKNNAHNAAIVLGENNVANRSSIALGKRSVEMPANNTYPAMLIDGKYYPVVKSSLPENKWAFADKAGFDSDGNLVNLWTSTCGETGHIAHINTRSRKAFFIALNSGSPVTNGEYVNGYTDDSGNFVEASVAPDPEHPIERYYRIVHNGVTFVGTTSYNPDPMDDQGAAGLGIDFACAAYFCVPNPAIQIDVEYDIDYLIEQKIWFPTVYRCGSFLGRTTDERNSSLWINFDENRAVRYAGTYSSYAPAYAPKNKVAVTGFDKDGIFYPYNGHNNGENELYVKVVPNTNIVMHAFTKDEYEEIGVKDFAELATWIPADENSIAIGDAQTVHGKSVGISATCARLPWSYRTEYSQTFTELSTSGESEPFTINTITEHDDTVIWPSEDTVIEVDDVSAGSIGLLTEQNLTNSKRSSIKNGSVGIGDQNTATDASITVGSNIVADSHSYAFGADSLHASGKSVVIGREGPVAEAGSIAIGMAGGYANCGSLIFGYSSITADYGSLAIGYSGVYSRYGSIGIGNNGAYTNYGSFLFGSGGNAQYGSYGFGQGIYAQQGAVAIGRYARATDGGVTLSTGNSTPSTGKAATGYLVRYRNPDGYYAPVFGSIRVKSGYTITRVRVLNSVWYNDVQYDYAVIGYYRDSDGYFNYYYNVNLYRNGVLAASPSKTEVRTAFMNSSEDMWMVYDSSTTYTFLPTYTDNSCTGETSNLKSLRAYLEVECRTFTRDGQLYVYADYNGYPDTDLTYEYISLNLCSFDVYSSWTGAELGYSSDGWNRMTALGGYNSGVAIGRNAHAEGSSVAIGINNSNESGGFTVGVTNSVGHRGDKFPTSLGYRIYDNYTSANGYSMAFGDKVHADGSSMAFGINAKAYNNSIVFGRDNVYADNYSLAIGQQGVTAKDCAVAIGANSNYASGYALAIGSNSNYANGYSLAVGWNSNRAVDYSTAFGDDNRAETYSTVFGKSSKALYNSFSVGRNAFAFDYSFTAGTDSSAYNRAVSVGTNNTAYEYSLAFGDANYAHHRGIVFGASNSADGNAFVAGMSNSAKNQSVAIGFSNTIYGENSEYGTLLGHSNTVLAGGYNVGFGKSNSTSREAIAIGVGNSVHGWSIGIGTGNSSPVSGGGHATIIGYKNQSLSDMETRTWEDTSSSTTYYLPLNSYYDYSWSEQIYTPDEIGPSGYIGSLSFCVSSYSTTRYLNIYLANTTKNKFTGNYDWVLSSSATLVFSGNVTFNVGWNTIPLNTSFQYDDSKNLCVIVVDNTGSYSSSMYFKSMSPGDGVYRSMYTYQDSSSYNPSSSSTYGYLTDNRPFIRFLIGGSTVSVPKIVPLSGSIPTNSILMGALNESNHFNSILIGVGNQSDSPHIIRDGEHYNTNDDDGFMIAIGRENYVGRNYDIAIGYKSVAYGGENIAVQHSTARGFGNIALEQSSIAYGVRNFAMFDSSLETSSSGTEIKFNKDVLANVLVDASLIGASNIRRNTVMHTNMETSATSTERNIIHIGVRKTTEYDDGHTVHVINAPTFNDNILIGARNGTKVPFSSASDITLSGGGWAMDRNVLLNNAYALLSSGGGGCCDNTCISAELYIDTVYYVHDNFISNSMCQVAAPCYTLSANAFMARSEVTCSDNSYSIDRNFVFASYMHCTPDSTVSHFTSISDITSNVLFGSTANMVQRCFSFSNSYNNGGGDSAYLEYACGVVNFGDANIYDTSDVFSFGDDNEYHCIKKGVIMGNMNIVDANTEITRVTLIGNDNTIKATYGSDNAGGPLVLGDSNNIRHGKFVFDNRILGNSNYIANYAGLQKWTEQEINSITAVDYPRIFAPVHRCIRVTGTMTFLWRDMYCYYYNHSISYSYSAPSEPYTSMTASAFSTAYQNGTLTNDSFYFITTNASSLPSMVSGDFMDDNAVYHIEENSTYVRELSPDDKLYSVAKTGVFSTEDAHNASRNLIIGDSNGAYSNTVGYSILGSGNIVRNTQVSSEYKAYAISNGFVQGNNNVVTDGSNIIAMGNGHVATGHNSVAIGMQLISDQWQTVLGKYNDPIDGPDRLTPASDSSQASKAIFMIGNGYSDTDGDDWQDESQIHRSNAMVVYADGTVKATSFVTDTDLTLTAGQGISIVEDSNLHTVTIGLDTELQQVLASHPGADGKRYTLECNNGQLGWVEVGVATV